METYLLKTILCSSVFLGFYYLILERQKAHQFKRFYLLFSILLSMLIPFISITYGVEKPVANDLIFIENLDAVIVPVVEETTIFTLENIVYTVYFIVTFGLFTRFLISLNALRKEINSGIKIKRGNYFLVLKEEKSTAHSFWKYIFLNKTDFENGKIDEKIIRHEEAHLRQKHSLDVLFMEFLLTIFWFNPAFYLYKKAMITNHEFLADEAVLKNENDIKSYQKLLLTELISERILFTNPFNLSNTKKRIKMMTTPKNNKSKLFSWLSLPLAAIIFFVFVEKVPASGNKSQIKQSEEKKENLIIKTSDDPYREIKIILSKYSEIIENKDAKKFISEVPKAEQHTLINLYKQLDNSKKLDLPIMINYMEYYKNVPAPQQLTQFQNKEYVVQIDDKLVDNVVLKNYRNTDFSLVYVMKVTPENPEYNYREKKYAVLLMTNKYFQEKNNLKEVIVGFKVSGEHYKNHKIGDTIRPDKKTKVDAKVIKYDKPIPNEKGELPPPPPIEERTARYVKKGYPIPPPPPSSTKQISKETQAEFPGGNGILRSQILKNVDTSKMISSTKTAVKGSITFIVTENGDDADIYVESDDKTFEKMILDAGVKTIEGVKWKPGTQNGKNVASYIKIPLTMTFEK